MKLTIVTAIVLVMALASQCSASPLLLTKHVAKKLLKRHFTPEETETVVVYTPVVQQHHPVVPVLPVVSSHPQLLPLATHVSPLFTQLQHPLVQPLQGKLLPGLGHTLLQHPWLQQLPLLTHQTAVASGVREVLTTGSGVSASPALPTTGPYPPAVVQVELPEEPAVETVATTSAPVVPASEYGVPVAVPAGVPATVYGPPGTGSTSSSTTAVDTPTDTDNKEGGAKYVAVNLGARHEAPLPGHTESVLMENLQPAPGTEGLPLPAPVVANDFNTRSWAAPVPLETVQQQNVPALDSPANVDWLAGSEVEPRYIAINGDLRHEAPLPGYDHSVVIENLDKL